MWNYYMLFDTYKRWFLSVIPAWSGDEGVLYQNNKYSLFSTSSDHNAVDNVVFPRFEE